MTGKQEGLADAVACDADSVGTRRAGRMTPPTFSFPWSAFAKIFKSSKTIAHASDVNELVARAARTPTARLGMQNIAVAYFNSRP